MKVDLFNFDLPAERIAQRPATPRDASRLLSVGGNLRDGAISDLPQLLRPDDLLVFNDTRVIPAQLLGRRKTAKITLNLHKRDADGTWRAFAKPARKLQKDDTIVFAPDFSAQVLEKMGGGEIRLSFGLSESELNKALKAHGAAPLPPYIKRNEQPDENDTGDYQTMFAEKDGAVAAPTAGLHFTPKLMAALSERGVNHTKVTLHVGAGTFLPVKVSDTQDHKMHAEYGEITPEAANAINRTRQNKGRIVCVGTTSLRLLESAADNQGRVHPFCGETDIFITPGYRFKIADMLLTNFHLPLSTLFMLVCAFSGRERMLGVYQHAKQKGYRFYSYGDACLLERCDGDDQ
jgi:S-adenosylmethionine:tRNA ribosyltransferase-isomerase